jgi:addiction module HigA family antidote
MLNERSRSTMNVMLGVQPANLPVVMLLGENAMALTAIHPGKHLAEELKELHMSAAELARKLDVPTNRVTGILNGQRAISGDTALRLAHFFGTIAEFWLNLQSLYELRLAQQKVGKSIKALPTLKRTRTSMHNGASRAAP